MTHTVQSILKLILYTNMSLDTSQFNNLARGFYCSSLYFCTFLISKFFVFLSIEILLCTLFIFLFLCTRQQWSSIIRPVLHDSSFINHQLVAILRRVEDYVLFSIRTCFNFSRMLI